MDFSLVIWYAGIDTGDKPSFDRGEYKRYGYRFVF